MIYTGCFLKKYSEKFKVRLRDEETSKLVHLKSIWKPHVFIFLLKKINEFNDFFMNDKNNFEATWLEFRKDWDRPITNENKEKKYKWFLVNKIFFNNS